MRVAILGTRGIPNHYGGFEQFAEYLSVGLVARGHQVSVYNAHNHPYQQANWRGVEIIHQRDPEQWLGTLGQFVYDLNCIRDARRRPFDIILQLGYGSSSIWGWLLPRKSVVITNMDGLEWKRAKYSGPVRQFLKFAEHLGVRYSDYLVADSEGIQRYLSKKYGVMPTFIPYGADLVHRPDEAVLDDYLLEPYGYDLAIARLETSNSIEPILEGVRRASTHRPFLLIGDYQSEYGQYLYKKFAPDRRIRFLGGLYDLHVLNNLRYFSNLYFHGHTVGGTNPSLLEAMASGALICAHSNVFNSSVLGKNAYYFHDAADVSRRLETVRKTATEHPKLDANLEKIKAYYSWERVISDYESLMTRSLGLETQPQPTQPQYAEKSPQAR